MVFISFPTTTTSEEETLLKKYEKLARKRRNQDKASKPEPEITTIADKRPTEAKDARKVIEQLKQSGQLPQIMMMNSGRKSEFKRKVPVQAPVTPAPEESMQVVSYDDDEDLYSEDMI